MILDTSFVVDVLRGDDGIADLVADVDASGPPKVTTVSIMELWDGVHRADTTEREREVVEEFVDGVHELPFTRECAKVAGGVLAELRTSGRPIGIADVQIAATAIVHDEPVVTRNVDRFDPIDGLETSGY